MSEHKVKSEEVLKFIQARGTVSTDQVAKRFRILKTQAAANLAILRIKEAIQPMGKNAEGVSTWATA
jgi:predicted HTH transcriptional regulator